MPVLAIKAAAIALAATGVIAGGKAELSGNTASAGKVYYTVRSGDTLSRIAGYFCHNPSRYHELAAANGIANPNIIGVGERIWLACGGSGSSSSGSSGNSGGSSSGGSISGSDYAAGSAAIPATSSQYSTQGLERLWMAAGGSGGTAIHAACIAQHESSGMSWVVSPTNDYGLWQIHNGGPAMLNAFANAQRAVAMSNNGTNWSQWTTARYC